MKLVPRRPSPPRSRLVPVGRNWLLAALVSVAIWFLVFQTVGCLHPGTDRPTIAEVAARVWQVKNADDSCYGSAFPFRRDGNRTYFLTAAHNLDFRGIRFPPRAEPPAPVSAAVLGDRRLPILGSICATHEDAALFWVEATDIPLLELRWTPLAPQEEVYAMGFPHGFGPLVRHGWVAPVRDDADLAHSAINMPGDSGGALLDLELRVVGILEARQDAVGVSVPLVSIRDWLAVEVFNASRR